MAEKYTLLKTLTRGKQQPKTKVMSDGTTKVTYYGAVFCYVLQDNVNGKKYAFSPFETADVVSMDGATNIRAGIKSIKGGGTTTSIIGTDGSVQSEKYVVTDYRGYLEENKDIVLSNEVKKMLERKPRATGTGTRKAAQPKYTAEQIREVIQAKKKAMAEAKKEAKENKPVAKAPAVEDKKAPTQKKASK